MQEVARRHAICTSLIYRRRRDASRVVGPSAPVRLVPVRITEPRTAEKISQESPRSASAFEPRRSGQIKIELCSGVRVRVDGNVSLARTVRLFKATRVMADP